MLDAAADASVAVSPGTEIVVKLNLTLDRVRYWSPDQPSMHTVNISLHAGGRTVDSQALRIGVRKLTTDGPYLRLNGERVQLKGFNRHEDYPLTGRAHDEDVLLADLQAIKRTGANFVRASHYPMHRRFYELCDELGIMVMDEIPLWGWGRDSHGADISAPIATAFVQLEELIRHQKNYTCVVIWSVSNESAGGQSLVDRTNIELMRRARELDSSRLVTHVALYSVWQQCADAAMDEDDVICLNEYEGSLNLNPPVRTTADLPVAQEQLGGYLDALHKKYPTVPVVITEFGGIGLPGHHYDSPWSEEGYAATIRAHWDVFAAREWIAGGLLWCWQDYPMHPNRNRIYPLGHYGVVALDRTPKTACLSTVTELFTEQ
jgi:beta-glucuronidase